MPDPNDEKGGSQVVPDVPPRDGGGDDGPNQGPAPTGGHDAADPDADEGEAFEDTGSD